MSDRLRSGVLALRGLLAVAALLGSTLLMPRPTSEGELLGLELGAVQVFDEDGGLPPDSLLLQPAAGIARCSLLPPLRSLPAPSAVAAYRLSLRCVGARGPRAPCGI